ncbi:MAG: M14 family metallopeptidase [Alphaproteobacteria bacterium]|nr:M14 family metallopeptidase [Alphaproteobacteria bacterium]
MSASQHFSRDYAEARRKFRDAALKAGARLTHYVNPTKGPGGEDLTTDVARLGPADASRVLMTISATHGAEGFCGSGIQVASFAGGFGRALPADTALVFVHAINPHGFSWIRRVTEENVDLNRNFVDHAQPLPRNDGYDELADAICPAEWEDAAASARLAAFAAKHGAAALQKAISGGQYRHKDGVFYGGTAPVWARRTLLRIIEEHMPAARHVGMIDYHTGLGPYGYGEQIVLHPGGSPAYARAEQWFGTITNPSLGNSSSAELHGDNLQGLAAHFAQTGVAFTGMALEYGTLSLKEVLSAVRADNWLHHHGDLASAKGRRLKAQMRDAFYCDKDDWKDMLVEQGMRAQRGALEGLAA